MAGESTEILFDVNFDEKDPTLDELFKEALEEVQKCRKQVDKIDSSLKL